MNYPKYWIKALVAISWLGLHTWAAATGVVPETTVLQISQKTNTAQMGVLNSKIMSLLLLIIFKAVAAVKAAIIKLFKPPFAMICQ